MLRNPAHPQSHRVTKQAGSWRTVTLFAIGFYVLFTGIALATHGWDPLWFAWQGDRYAQSAPEGTTGYDGQFVLYIARDGWGAVPHLDNPAYRLQRILTPVVVRVLSLGMPVLVPWIIILVNAVSIIAATAILAHWLSGQATSPWYALTYTLFVGTLMPYSRDLTEPLALCLAALGAVMWLREDYSLAIVSWSLAALAKEITLIFPVGAVAASIYRGKIRLAVGAALTAAPLVCWEAYLYVRLGEIPFLSGPSLEPVPLLGVIRGWSAEPGGLSAAVLVALAAVVLFPISLRCLRRHSTPIVPIWLLLHTIFVLLLPSDVYSHIMHAGRNAGGMILSLTLLLPSLWRAARPLALGYSVVPTVMWLVPILRWAPWLSSAGLPGRGG